MVKEYLNKYKEELKKCIEDLKHSDTVYKQVPNMLTFSRAIGMIPVNILLLTSNVGLGIGLIAVLLVTDFFDGRIARKWNIQSKFGADLDAVCDKFMFLGLAIPLMINNPMLISNFILEGVISYINVLGRMKGLDTKTVFAGKIKTCFLSATLFVGYLVQFFGINPTLFTLLTSMTFGAQVMTINTYTKEYSMMKIKKSLEEIEKQEDLVKITDNNLSKDLTLMEDKTIEENICFEEKNDDNIYLMQDSVCNNRGKVRVRKKEENV